MIIYYSYINNKKAPIGTPSPTYICKKCGKSGHFIQNCPVEPGVTFLLTFNDETSFSLLKL